MITVHLDGMYIRLQVIEVGFWFLDMCMLQITNYMYEHVHTVQMNGLSQCFLVFHFLRFSRISGKPFK